MYSGSFVEIHKKTTFQFENMYNKATNLGDAIYAKYLGALVKKTSMDCFILYYDIITSPTHWKTLFKFTNTKPVEVPHKCMLHNLVSIIPIYC